MMFDRVDRSATLVKRLAEDVRQPCGHAHVGGIAPTLHASNAELVRDLAATLRRVMIVARSFLGIAGGASHGQVLELVPTAESRRPDVLECCLAMRASIVSDDELGVAVNALTDPSNASIDRHAIERSIGDRCREE